MCSCILLKKFNFVGANIKKGLHQKRRTSNWKTQMLLNITNKGENGKP